VEKTKNQHWNFGIGTPPKKPASHLFAKLVTKGANMNIDITAFPVPTLSGLSGGK